MESERVRVIVDMRRCMFENMDKVMCVAKAVAVMAPFVTIKNQQSMLGIKVRRYEY